MEMVSIPERIKKLRENFEIRDLSYRQKQLTGLNQFLKIHEKNIEEALYEDLCRCSFETYSSDIALVKTELRYTQKHLSSWIKPKRVSTILAVQPAKGFIYHEPFGVVLILSPWNYPIQLSLSPLIGAIAAGNSVVLKPSELAPATSRLMAEMLPEHIDSKCLQIIEGGSEEASALLNEPFDYIFYTGNGKIGRIVMAAAAKHLTPVTLELGGKSPCIVDENTDIKVAVRRILFGKFYNAGQTCVAPDYILVHKKIEHRLLECTKETLREFYGDDPKSSPDFARIINEHHYLRLIGLIPGSGEIIIGGDADKDSRYIAPTVLHHVPHDSSIMGEEIFGPLLPVIAVNNIDEAILFVNKRPKPLALYLFSNSNEIQKKVIENTSSGGVCINHSTLQLIVPTLPFGGVGPSGIGSYHGKTSYETFSHRKSVLKKPIWFDPKFIYPPYSESKKRWIKWVLK